MKRLFKSVFAQFLLGMMFFSCAPKNDTYTVIVSLDAFRWDYPDLFETPGLDSIVSDGLRGVLMPSYPASTFPNHYTIATGLVPDHHGIVNSAFWDEKTQKIYSMGDSLTRYNPEYYLGEPIWVTAEKAGVKTASIYWVASDVNIQNTLPTYTYPWCDEPRLTFEERADETVRLLSLPESERPKLVMVYFDEPDLTSHYQGPLSTEAKEVVEYLDSLVADMHCRLQELPHGDKINIIVVSDHGMTDISDERFINWNDYLKPSWYEQIVSTNPTNIYAKENFVDSIMTALSGVEHIQVWKHGNVPVELNYGTSDRCGDIIVAPELGWQFADRPRGINGAHGYSPQEKDMQSIFIASGPYFEGVNASENLHVRNIDIYSLLADMLSIKPVKTDGRIPEL